MRRPGWPGSVPHTKRDYCVEINGELSLEIFHTVLLEPAYPDLR